MRDRARGERISRLRKRVPNMRQQDVARALGVGYRTYQSWEEGRATPQGINLERLAGFFGVRCDEILAEHAPAAPDLHEKIDQLQDDVAELLRRMTAAGF